MITADPSAIAHPLMRVVSMHGISVPIVAIDNATVEFVTTMPPGKTAPSRISGITYTTVPCILFTHQPTGRTDLALAGGAVFAEGFADFIVICPLNEFASRAGNIAGQIAALFPKGRAVFLAGATATITRPATVLPGFNDGVYWRVPVRVNYRAA